MTLRTSGLFGIPIDIHASWLLILALMTYAIGVGYLAGIHNELSLDLAIEYGAIASLVFFACILAHEFAHAPAISPRRFSCR